jgi:hypothetical protein
VKIKAIKRNAEGKLTREEHAVTRDVLCGGSLGE